MIFSYRNDSRVVRCAIKINGSTRNFIAEKMESRGDDKSEYHGLEEPSIIRIMIIINIALICQILTFVDSTNDATTHAQPVIKHVEKEFAVSTRIVGGEPANIKSYPFAVSIQWRLGSKHHCGGSYIMPRFVLSAAHCMVRYNGYRWLPENPRFYLVLAGSSNLWYSPTWQIVVTDAVLPHPSFNYGTMAHDIGLYRVSKPLRITPYVGYAPLPMEYDSELISRKNQTCTVVGWGKTSESSTMTSDILQHVNVPLMPTDKCNHYLIQQLHTAQICAGLEEGGIDACQGDSGGPLLCNGVVIGIVSWGFGCAAPRSPGVYCRVDHYMNWIKRTVMKNNARTNDTLDVTFFSLIICFSILLSQFITAGNLSILLVSHVLYLT